MFAGTVRQLCQPPVLAEREAADRRVGTAVEPHLDQPADPAGRAGGDPGVELRAPPWCRS